MTVPGFIGAIGSDCSPIPSRGELLPTKTITQIPLDDPAKAYLKSLRLSYLEPVDKLFFPEAKSNLPSSSKNCGLWAKIGQCKNGHRFAKQLFCGKPYCDTCREITHQRKIGRGMPKIQQIQAMAKWVIRPPDDLQPLLRTKKQRAAFTKKVADALVSVGYSRLLWFKHDFGDKSTKYAFHLENIVDGAYLPPEQLDDLKHRLRSLIYPRWVVRRWGDKLDIWYGYYQTPAEMVFALKYATHPTFTNIDWDRKLARELNGERYSGYRGNWEQPEKWQLTENDRHLDTLASLEQKKCPWCGEKMTWGERLLPFVLVLMDNPIALGTGYYSLPSVRDPPVHCRSPSPSTSNTQTRCP
ncbi:hypothetical protein ES703_42585 [subsurface metagenome]